MLRPALLLLTLSLGACATAPGPLRGEFAAFSPEAASAQAPQNEHVRWGGRVVKVEPKADHSCFEIVSTPLASSGRPERGDRSFGRFLACRGGFYDPEVFKPGREITIVGRYAAVETHKVGEFDYRYPRVEAEAIYLWPERRDVDVIIERSPFGHYHPWGWR